MKAVKFQPQKKNAMLWLSCWRDKRGWRGRKKKKKKQQQPRNGTEGKGKRVYECQVGLMARKPQAASLRKNQAPGPQTTKDGAWSMEHGSKSRTSSSDSNNKREPPARNRTLGCQP